LIVRARGIAPNKLRVGEEKYRHKMWLSAFPP
jgi:hypothetical protein